MKSKMIMLSSLLGILLICCSTTSNVTNLKGGVQIDKRFVGTWEGNISPSENIRISRNWQITRKSDGTFSKSVVGSLGGRRQQFQKSGNWYTKNGMYYETDLKTKETDEYRYTFVKKSKIELRISDDEENLIFVENLKK